MQKGTSKRVNDFNKEQHLLIGLFIGNILTNNAQQLTLILLGSILPDIDHRRSTLGKMNPFVKWMKHRGITHRITGCILLSAPFLYWGIESAVSVLIGCLLHLLGDWLSSMRNRKGRRFKVRF